MLVDAEILRRVSLGDREAAGRLVEGIWPDAYRIAQTATRHAQTAEDVAQNACIEMLASLPGLRNPAAFRSWFFRLVTRAAYRELRRRGREQLVDVLPEQPVSSEEQSDLHAALWSLDGRERLVIVLHYHYGFRSGEIAWMLGIAAGSVRYELWRVRRRLRQLLEEEDRKRGDSHGAV